MKGVALGFACLLCVCLGCRNQAVSSYDGYRTTPADPSRDTEKAQKSNAQGVELLQEGKLDEAEKEFKGALEADLFFGPAHNNLGVVYQRQGNFYLAAWEFQYASKLMPYKAEAFNNLGMVYEAVGRLDESAKWYDQALSLEPANIEVIANTARVLAKTHKDKARLRTLLDEVIMRDQRPEWVAWAKEERALLGNAVPAVEEPPAGTGK